MKRKIEIPEKKCICGRTLKWVGQVEKLMHTEVYLRCEDKKFPDDKHLQVKVRIEHGVQYL